VSAMAYIVIMTIICTRALGHDGTILCCGCAGTACSDRIVVAVACVYDGTYYVCWARETARERLMERETARRRYKRYAYLFTL